MEISEALIAELQSRGLLLQQDLVLPNVVAAVAGEPVRGSWWSHRQAHTIFACLNTIAQHPDVLVSRLVRGKVTFVHRRLWDAVLAVGRARAPWQFARLSPLARELYESVERHGTLLATGTMARTIERRLLVHGEQVHTAAGHHEIALESWSYWAERVGCHSTLTAQEGQRQLEAAVQALGGTVDLLPWGRG